MISSVLNAQSIYLNFSTSWNAYFCAYLCMCAVQLKQIIHTYLVFVIAINRAHLTSYNFFLFYFWVVNVEFVSKNFMKYKLMWTNWWFKFNRAIIFWCYIAAKKKHKQYEHLVFLSFATNTAFSVFIWHSITSIWFVLFRFSSPQCVD